MVDVPALVLAAQGREGPVAHQLVVPREGVEEARLAGVVVPSDADRGEAQTPPLPDPLAVLLHDGVYLLLDARLAAGDLTELPPEAVLAHAAEEGAVVVVAHARLQLEVRSELSQPRRLYLEFAQVVRGHLVEYLQGDLVAVHDVDAQGLNQVELLAAPQVVVEDHQVDVVSADEASNLLDLARADVETGKGTVTGLDHVPDDLYPQRLHEAPQLYELDMVDHVVVDVGLEHTEDCSSLDVCLHTISAGFEG